MISAGTTYPLSPATATAVCALSCLASFAPAYPQDDAEGWAVYGGDPGGQRYSSLTQIDRSNVQALEIAWQYRTGELGEGFARAGKLAFEATPILVEGALYLSTPTNVVVALDPVTGRERWRYDPAVPRDRDYSEATSRGVSSWLDPRAQRHAACRHRIFQGTLDARLIAIDGRTGAPCSDFGRGGAVDLGEGVRLRDPGDYLVTSPPAIYDDLVIIGSAIGDNRAVELERGTVRAFDARSGALRWAWEPVPLDAASAQASGWLPAAAERTGAANAWSILSVDPARGIVYVPTGSASPDFYGGERLGDNAYANSLVALEAATGGLLWHRQLVHHDLWDYDLASQPALIELERNGKIIAAVAQATKMGMVFLFDRETGLPVFDVVERAVPGTDVPGERVAATQPFATTAPLVSHAAIGPDDAWGLTFYDRGKCRERIATLRSEGIYTPPSLKGSIQSPGYAGGVNWGSLAYDPVRQVLIAAVTHLPMIVQLIEPALLPAMAGSGDYPRSEFAWQRGTPYAMRREPLLSPWGLPCTLPPWGTLVALDLQQNAVRWQVPLGSTRDLTPWFIPARTLGTPNAGGPIVTAGGLAFVGAAMDDYLRAFDVETGRELWKGRLPAGGQATPMTYQVGDRQFVVIAAGGHGGLGTRRGDHVVAFALPEDSVADR